jgi:hypothetical protein
MRSIENQTNRYTNTPRGDRNFTIGLLFFAAKLSEQGEVPVVWMQQARDNRTIGSRSTRSTMLSRTRKLFSFAVLFSVFGLLAGFFPGARLYAENAQFDLQGPTLEVKVQRDGRTLPISEVPTLQPGDRLWLHPVLGEHESVHYLMVAVFLRGSTNPPPDDWFHKVEAWNKDIMEEGTYILVPPGAEQAVVLFAPQTGGDFSTLKSAVRGRPGAFVRASQDLAVAGLDRARINTYLKYVRGIDGKSKGGVEHSCPLAGTQTQRGVF